MTLREARQGKNLTQEQLAELAGVDQATISDLERGRNENPSWGTVSRIASVLEVDPRVLFPTQDSKALAS